ncbi:methyltransferase domain-containing protein [Paenibacillus woosongensis]|uniref:Methyltransferase domain-containing protein n=1 Tax=Paenibacillus woosongensis TaxID=307580 RepID=A0AA95KWX9_9BACL|nr:methyltransferase domain-containing protein [Paenibacillus woosongensis]WHX50230.1 methyltransferase domain-containing protein [Paenibacillus woosongensis]
MLIFHTIPAGTVICSVCSGTLELQDNSLICKSRHCFDIAKQGYVNFLLQAPKEKYDKRLFQSRARVSQAGVFRGLTDRLGEIVRNELERQRGELVQQKVVPPSLGQSPGERQHTTVAILDAGCGEGSHLSALVRHLAGTSGCKLVAAGIDISKAGIQLAAKANPGMLWGVADLAKCPFANGSFDIILNILSPANYSEFHRMLADDGLVMKVIPGTEYLQEIRRALHSETGRRTYSNDRTIELFRRHFELVDMQQVKYELLIEQKDWADLLQMTPLAWQAGEEQLRLMQAMNKQPVITFDFVILIGRKRYKR